MNRRDILLKPSEELLQTVRTSLASSALKIALMSVWLLTPFFFLFPLFSQGITGIVFFVLLLGSGLAYALRWQIRYRHTRMHITTHRVIFCVQNGVFDRTVNELLLSEVTDVAYRIKGFLPTLLNYGAVKVIGKSGAAKMVFFGVKHPQQLQHFINEVRARDFGKSDPYEAVE